MELSGRLTIFCDGSCIGNGREGAAAGFGVYIKQHDRVIHSYSEKMADSEPQTNQRAELLAMKYVLEYLCENPAAADVYTDSHYVMNCLAVWCATWEKNGWRSSAKKPVKHSDIIKPMYTMYSALGDTLKIHHVAAHTGGRDEISKGNAVVDKLAHAAASAIVFH